MQRFRQNMSLRNRFIFTSYASILISVILISVVSYVLLGKNSEKYAIQTNQDIVSQKADSIGLIVDRIEYTMRDIIYSQELQRLLAQYKTEPNPSLLNMKIQVNNAIGSITSSLYSLDNVVLFSANGDMVGSMLEFDPNRNAYHYGWYDQVQASNGQTCWLTQLMQESSDSYGSHFVIPAVKKIRALHMGNGIKIGDTLGYVLVFLNMDSTVNSLQVSDTSNMRSLFLVDASKRIIASNDQSQIGQYLKPLSLISPVNNSYLHYDDSEYLFTYAKITDTVPGWHFICLAPRSEILWDANIALIICLSVSAVLLVSFLVLSIRNASSLTRPIELLKESFGSVEKGHFDITIQEKTNIHELDDLINHFNLMVYRLDNLIYEVYEARIKEQHLIADVRQAELQALQMQINPHFLYNTLDSINWMALMQGNEDVSKMVLALGNLFRSNMTMRGVYTTIREELENTRLFMYLEQVRFEGKLHYTVTAAEELMDCKIIKLLLQPLVENAIKHGLEPYDIRGEISISIYYHLDRIIVSIADNGRGMPPQTLEKIRALWNSPAQEQQESSVVSGGVGLSNIIKRLRLCYKDTVNFEIISAVDTGTRMTISYPIADE